MSSYSERVTDQEEEDEEDLTAPSTPNKTTATSYLSGYEGVQIGASNKLSTIALAYIPHHSDPKYSDVDFFRRVRARHYVLSTLEPSPQVLDALLEGKQSWTGDDKELGIYN